MKLHARRYNRGEKDLSEAARLVIEGYNWPGNVRELSNVIERAVLLKAGTQIESSDLALSPMASMEAPSIAKAGDYTLAVDLSKGIVLEELERTIIETVLTRTGWNRTRAARSFSAFRAKHCATASKNTI